MNLRTIAMSALPVMNEKACASITCVWRSSEAVNAPWITGHSAMRATSAAHAGWSRIAITSSDGSARHGVPACTCFIIAMRSIISSL